MANSEGFGKCAKCDAALNMVTAGHIVMNVPGGTEWHGISYTCPRCTTILGLQMDPIALKNDIVNEVVERLKSR